MCHPVFFSQLFPQLIQKPGILHGGDGQGGSVVLKVKARRLFRGILQPQAEAGLAALPPFRLSL